MTRDDRPADESERDAVTGAEPLRGALLRAGRRLGAGRYTLERQLGWGGMAAVWLAHDERLDRPVAVKVLSDTLAGERDYLARFRREARVAAQLSHPGLVPLYDYGAEGGRPFLVMEYVAGGDLAERLEARSPPDPDSLARELLGALEHIHTAGVLHRDIKPRNVLLGDDDRARLTDFGIAQSRDATALTRTGMVVGTAPYLAPEVLAGEPASERSDLYSLGILLGRVAEVRAGSPALDELIEELRSQDPERRPASAADALRAIERSAAPPPEPTVPMATAGSTRRGGAGIATSTQSRDRRRPFALGALAAVALAVLAVALLTSGNEAAPPTSPVAVEEPAGEAELAEEEPSREPDQPEDPPPDVDGAALNDRGFELINQGRPEEAIPLLRQAVEALEGSGEITYAWALFNLGHALRLAGHPEEAIPILEQRLEIPNQRGVVREELERARRDAGQDRGRGRGRGRDDGRDD